MEGHTAPLSITETEANYFINFIQKYNLISGYEICTGFGISSAAIGLGMKQTGGHLTTIDGYMEEKAGDYIVYRNNLTVNSDNEGYKSVNNLIKFFKLEGIVTPVIGISPQDVKVNSLLDFVFIDSLHTPEQAELDLTAVIPYLKSQYAIFLHDSGIVVSSSLCEFVKSRLNQEIKPIEELTPPNGYYMSIISNLNNK